MTVRSARYREIVSHHGYARADGRQLPAGKLLSLVVTPPITEVGPAFCPAVLGQEASGVGITYVGRSEGESISGDGLRPPASVFMVDIAWDPTDGDYEKRATEVVRRVAALANDLRSAPNMMLDVPFAPRQQQ